LSPLLTTEAKLSILSQFKIIDAPIRKDKSPVARFRRRLADAIDLQIQLAAAESGGQTFRRSRQRWVKNQETGASELKERSVRVRRWWWTNDAGKVCVGLRYGMKPLEVAPGKSAIEVGNLTDLPAALTGLRDAVRAGELDACAEAAKFGRAVPKKAAADPASSRQSEAKRHGLRAVPSSHK
jgi:hypothetical protein